MKSIRRVIPRCVLPMLVIAIAHLAARSTANDGASGIGEYVPFNSNLTAGAKCMVEARILHPTQFSVGMKEVELRTEHFRQLHAGKQDQYLRKRVMPLVIGPRGVPFALDHHHLARMLLDSGLRSALYAEIKENWNRLTEDDFWKQMKQRHWMHLCDETGAGPLDPSQLPKTIAGLRDDPYRSVAWSVRERGGCRETDVPFEEFQWADFFRTRILFDTIRTNYDQAVNEALRLAASEDARSLPGFVPKQIPDRISTSAPQ